MKTLSPELPSDRRRSAAGALLSALRLPQWVKNGFVFAPLVFAGRMYEPALLGHAAVAFLAFSLASSAVYLLNDVVDAEADRLHPKKRLRPVAAGELTPTSASITAVVLAMLGLGLGVTAAPGVGIVVAGYLGVNVLYTWWLKHVVILDVFALAAGFVLRVEAGSLAAGVPASTWLLVCTSMLALFLGFSKRRHELAFAPEGPARRVLADYSVAFVDKMMNLVEAVTVIAYVMYTVSPETEARFGRGILFTVPFVLYGIFRYQYLIYHRRTADNPTDVLLTDGPLLAAVAGWLAVAAIVAN